MESLWIGHHGDVVWWTMHKLDVEEWLVRVLMVSSRMQEVRVNGTLSEEFVVKVGVHQGSVLGPLLFIMVLEAIVISSPRISTPSSIVISSPRISTPSSIVHYGT